MIKLTLQRFSGGADATLGLLFVDGEFACYTLEDEFRTQKIFAETRIPAGEYEVVLREAGGMHSKYLARFGGAHHGMLWLRKVPGFEWVYIHIGNKDDDTAGCILVGNGQTQNVTQQGSLLHSTAAYERIYASIAGRMLSGDVAWIRVLDESDIGHQAVAGG